MPGASTRSPQSREARKAPTIEATRLRAPRHEAGDTFVLTIETHAGPMDFRMQRGWLENLADNANAVLGRELSVIQKLDRKSHQDELAKICDQAQGLIFLVEKLKKPFAPSGQPSAPPTSGLSPTRKASPTDSASVESAPRTDSLPVPFPPLTRGQWHDLLQEWMASGKTLERFAASKGHDFKYVRNCLDGEFFHEVASHQCTLRGRGVK